MSDPNNLPSEMWGALLRIEGATARTEGKVDALGLTVSGLTTRVDGLETLTNDQRSKLDKIEGERSQMVPEFKALLDRTDNLEDWRTQHLTNSNSTKTITLWIVEKLWPVFAAIAVWLGSHYFYDHPAIEHREKTTIESTVSAPPPASPN